MTDRRVIVKTGWLSKHQTEVRIKDIRGVALEASIWERIIGTGSIAIGTAATAKAEIKMFGIKKPQEIVNMINEMRDDM
ncbi:MAG: PH domain-containing protein [Kiritimatiellae bacterium]|nr:PH domain-containing protein [Kiritimatiellia bacterium]